MIIGVVGFGDVAERYVDHLQQRHNSAIFVLADTDVEVRTRILESGRACVQSLAQMLARCTPDAVLILTPPATHVALAAEAALASPLVVVEKPPALTVTGLDSVASLGSTLHCVAPYRSMPAYAHALDLLSHGDNAQITMRVNWPRHDQYFVKQWRRDFQSGGGPLWNIFFHQMDMAVSLLRKADDPINFSLHQLTARQAKIDISSTAGLARLILTTQPTVTFERCEIRVGRRSLMATGRRFSEEISIDGKLVHSATTAEVVTAYTEAALGPLAFTQAVRAADLASTIDLLERVHSVHAQIR